MTLKKISEVDIFGSFHTWAHIAIFICSTTLYFLRYDINKIWKVPISKNVIFGIIKEIMI